MRRTKEDAALTRERLLQAAQISFSSKGFTATTLDDIAQQAGTTRGAIQWHFGNKADLFNTLIRERYIRAIERIKDIHAQGGTPLQVLRKLLVWWLSYPEEDADFRAILEILMLKTEKSDETASELAEGIQENIQGTQYAVQSFADLIQRGIAAGELLPSVNPETAARAALGLIYGTTSIWLMNPTSFSLKANAEEIVRFFLEGIVQS